jgi:hypothetical protein
MAKGTKGRASNIDQMRKLSDATRRGGGGDFYKFDAGDTLIYVCPPCREGDEYEPTKGTPYVPIGVHYGIGGSMVPSLDPDDNPIIDHPFVKKELKKAGKKLTGKCPVKAAIEGEQLTDEEADNSKLSVRYLWAVKPLGFRKSKKKDAKFMDLDDDFSVLMMGPQLNDALIEIFEENGDITDPDAAIRVVVSKSEGGGKQIAYKARAYAPDLKKPFALSKKEKAGLYKALENGVDLFRLVASLIKPPSKVLELLGDAGDDEDDEDEKPKKSKGKDKGGKSDKKAKGKKKDEEGEDDEEEEEDEDESDDDDSDEESSDDDEEESDDEESDDDDESDEEEDDEEEEEEKPKKSKGKEKSKEKPKDKKKGKKTSDDDDDDLDLEDLEESLENLDDEEDEEDDEEDEKPKKSKKGKAGKKGK